MQESKLLHGWILSEWVTAVQLIHCAISQTFKSCEAGDVFLNWSSIPLSYTLHQKCVIQLSLQHHFMSSSVRRPVPFVSLCCGFFSCFLQIWIESRGQFKKTANFPILFVLWKLSSEFSIVFCFVFHVVSCEVPCYKEKAGKLDPFNGQVLAQ